MHSPTYCQISTKKNFGMFNTTDPASKSFTTLRLLTEFKIQKRKRKFYKFCNENMRKSFFSVIDFDILKMESFGSEEHALLHKTLFKSQNFDEDMLVKPDNLHNSIQMKKINKIREIRDIVGLC